MRLATGLVASLQATDMGFVAETTEGQHFTSCKVLLATGVRDLLPPLPGFAACWGQPKRLSK